MISINAVELSQDLFWVNELTSPLASYSEERTVLGTNVVTIMPLVGGRDIILRAYKSGTEVQGYFTYEQVLQFRVLAQSVQIVPFVYESVNLNILIKPDAIAVVPHIERPNPELTDKYSGTITLKEV